MKDRARQRFEAEELAVVLSHYDLGVIESVTDFERGSRRSPKVGIVADRGKFLLKRRAVRRRSARRVALAHAVQKRLAEVGYPLAALVPTRDGDTGGVRRGDDLYELFEFIPGHAYGRTIDQTRDAGRWLGRFHEALAGFETPEGAPGGSYHDVNEVRSTLNAIPSSISSHDSVMGREAELPDLVQTLFDAYDRAADAANARDFSSLPTQVVHGDWHPGNMLFKRDAVVAVVDYDSCHVGRRVTDVANGVLQFSLTTADKLSDWPDAVDRDRFGAFMDGYGEAAAVSATERACVPLLMIEALIGESVYPVARTGSFGGWTGFGFLEMIARKVAWIEAHADALARAPAGDAP